MIMRVTWGKIREGKWDEYERLWNEHAADTSGADGLRGRWLLRDTETPNAGYSLSLWDSPGDFEAYSRVGDRKHTARMTDCFVGQYVTTVCEVRGTHGDAALG